MNLKNTRLGT